MADAIARKNSLHYAGNDYYKANASVAGIGAVGEKRTPVTKANFIEVKDRISADKLKIREIGPVKIDSQRTNKLDFLANVNLAKVFKIGSVDTAYEDVLKSDLQLVFMAVDVNDMVEAINRSPRIREDLDRWGNNARVVTSGFVIVEAKTARDLSSSTDVEAEVNVHGITIKPKLGVSTNDRTEVVFPVGSLYAYGLHKLFWDKKSGRVEDLKFDGHGL